MRTLRDLAAPDDPQAWTDCSNMWPTLRNTYATADNSTGTLVSSTFNSSSAYQVYYAYAAGQYIANNYELVVIDTSAQQAWNAFWWNGSTLSDSVAAGAPVGDQRGRVQATRFGDVVLLAAINNPLLTSLKIQAATIGGSFSDAGSSAPTQQTMIAVQSSAAIATSHYSNSWYASDVGDYSNWSTGESASGTFYQLPGYPTAAIPYGNDLYVFKPSGILRMTYVGGAVKWQVQLAWYGVGIPRDITATYQMPTQDQAVATNHGIAFYGGSGRVYLFDGTSEPVCLNPETTINVEASFGVFIYDPRSDMLCIAPSFGSDATGHAYVDGATTTSICVYYYYNFKTGAWGNGYGNANEIRTSTAQNGQSGVLRGSYGARAENSSKPAFWVIDSASSHTLYRNASSSPASGTTCSLQISKLGRADGKTRFSRLTPLLRSRSDLGSGSAAAQFDLFTEREDTSTSNSRTGIAESTTRKRFDLLGGTCEDTFGRFKVTWTSLNVEVDDFLVNSTFVQDGD